MRNTLQIQLDRLASDRWARRGVRLLLRASALALSLICIALGLHLLLDWSLRWSWLASAALSCIALGALLVLRPRMSAHEVARRLDRSFGLHEQLATALELGPQADGVGAYLHEQSRRSLAQIRREVTANQRFPWPDLVLMLATGLLLFGLFVLSGIGTTAPSLGSAEPLPPLAAVPDPAQRFPDEPPQPPPGTQPDAGTDTTTVSAPGDMASVAALADALRDQSVTRPAAEALDNGNLAGAAKRLRELADQAGQLSDQARAELSQSLRQAADQIAQTSPALADQVRASAEGVAPASDTPGQALEALAEAVEQLGQGQSEAEANQGQNPSDQQQSADAPQGGGGAAGAGNSSLPGEQRERPSDRLGVDGVPLELAGSGSGDTPAQGETNGPATAGTNTGSGGFSSAPQSTERVAVGDDPLRIPADLRDVVQDYFSP